MVKASDRKYQVGERDPLSVSLWSHPVFEQKVNYIHANPVVAGICKFPEEYKYSSASFYLKAAPQYSFLTHYNAWDLLVKNTNKDIIGK